MTADTGFMFNGARIAILRGRLRWLPDAELQAHLIRDEYEPEEHMASFSSIRRYVVASTTLRPTDAAPNAGGLISYRAGPTVFPLVPTGFWITGLVVTYSGLQKPLCFINFKKQRSDLHSVGGDIVIDWEFRRGVFQL